MGTQIEIVWEQLKARAQDCAEAGLRPTIEAAHTMVSKLIQEANLSPVPPQEVLDMYVGEFLGMVDAAMHPKPDPDAA
jgi:hypothetical protein